MIHIFTDKDKFWRALQEPDEKHCGNCVRGYNGKNNCEVPVYECFGLKSYNKEKLDRPYFWEWDGKNE